MSFFKTEHRRALSLLLAVLLILSVMAVTTLMPNSLFTMSVGADATDGDATDDYITPPSPSPSEEPEPSTFVEETVTAASTTTGGNTSASVSSSQMNQAVNKAVSDAAKIDGAAPKVIVEVNTPANATSLEVTLPTASLGTLADASGSRLSISSSLATVELNHTALAALAGSAKGSDVTLDVAPVAASAMNAKQTAAVQGATVMDVSLTSGGTAIHDFNNGTISISLAYTLKSGETASNIVAYFMDSYGYLSRRSTSFADGKVTFNTTHLSPYVIGTRALEQTVDFTDVASGAYYYDAVVWGSVADVTKGTGDGTTFSPNVDCSRAQFATFLWRAAGSPEPTSTTNKFTDVDATKHEAYYKAILWGAEQGIINGATETTFNPDGTVTRAQAVTLMYRYAQKAGIATKTGGTAFTDAPNSGSTAAYYDAILWAVANGITNGNSTTANTFGPSDGCIRAQMIVFLYRLFSEAA